MLMIESNSEIEICLVEMSISDEELRSDSIQELGDESVTRSLRHPAWSQGTVPDDKIEILSSHYEHTPELLYIEAENTDILYHPFFKDVKDKTIHVKKRTRGQTLIARAVLVVSTLLFTMSLLLVIVSLTMSDHIDELVRSKNEKLLKKVTTTSGQGPLLSVKGPSSNSTVVNS